MRLLGPYFGYILVLWGDQEPKNKFKLRILDVELVKLESNPQVCNFLSNTSPRETAPFTFGVEKHRAGMVAAGMVAASDAAARRQK